MSHPDLFKKKYRVSQFSSNFLGELTERETTKFTTGSKRIRTFRVIWDILDSWIENQFQDAMAQPRVYESRWRGQDPQIKAEEKSGFLHLSKDIKITHFGISTIYLFLAQKAYFNLIYFDVILRCRYFREQIYIYIYNIIYNLIYNI